MTRNKFSYVALASIVTIALNGYMWYENPNKFIPDMFRRHASSIATTNETCDMPSMKPAAIKTAMSTVATQKVQQDPGQQNPQSAQQAPEADVRCERPNPNGSNPDQGGQDPKKVGCKCMRKCVNGKPNENFDSPEVRCKVHCKPDHCDCPDPCKT